MKKFIAGLVIGIILSSGFVYAAQSYTALKASFKIFVDGKEFVSTDKPPVTISGSTYLPLRAIGNALGVQVNWNAEKRQVEIGDMNPGVETGGYIKADNLEIKVSGYEFLPGYRTFNVEFKNSGTVQISYDPAQLKCDGRPSIPTFSIGDKPALQAGKLAPGASITGKVAFTWDGTPNKTTFDLTYKGTFTTTYSKK